MNFGNIFRGPIFKGVAQGLVDAALPAIKAELLGLLTKAISSAGLPAAYQAQALTQVQAALDNWAIKL